MSNILTELVLAVLGLSTEGMLSNTVLCKYIKSQDQSSWHTFSLVGKVQKKLYLFVCLLQ